MSLITSQVFDNKGRVFLDALLAGSANTIKEIGRLLPLSAIREILLREFENENHWLEIFGNIEVIEALHFVNAELIEIKDNFDRTIMHLNAYLGNVKAIRKLHALNSGLINMKAKFGRTCMHFAVADERIEAIRAIHELNNQFIFMEDNIGNAMHLAAFRGHAAAIKALYKLAPALINMPNQRGETPLHVAQKFNQEKAVKALMKIIFTKRRMIEMLVWINETKKYIEDHPQVTRHEDVCSITGYPIYDLIQLPSASPGVFFKFERSALLRWLLKHPINPSTREIISVDTIRQIYIEKAMGIRKDDRVRLGDHVSQKEDLG